MKCMNCDKEFKAMRSTTKYCSRTCQLAHRKLAFQDDEVNVGTSGYVYIAQSGERPYYKIGFSTRRPITRIGDMQTGNPDKLKVVEVFWCINASEVEKRLHWLFRAERVQGEWFKLTPEQLERLITILTGEPVYEIIDDEHSYQFRTGVGQTVGYRVKLIPGDFTMEQN